MSEDQKSSSQDLSGEKSGSSIVSMDAHQKSVIRLALVESARKLIGIPYSYGAEWENFSAIPTELDCSEMTRGVYIQNGLKMPDTSQNQFDYCVPTGNPQPGDLAFFGRGGKASQIYHVGLLFDKFNIIEARGLDPSAGFVTGEVILRIRTAWEKYRNFMGYRSHPKLV